MSSDLLDHADLDGRDPDVVRQCIDLLRTPPEPVTLLRACVASDGLLPLPSHSDDVNAAAHRVCT
ncbi:MAG: hypothetical protein ACI9MC_004250, partial [Kiritimatiellia bacterium]